MKNKKDTKASFASAVIFSPTRGSFGAWSTRRRPQLPNNCRGSSPGLEQGPAAGQVFRLKIRQSYLFINRFDNKFVRTDEFSSEKTLQKVAALDKKKTKGLG